MRWMNQLKQMTLFHFRLMQRQKVAFFFNLIMPLLFLLIFGFMYGGGGGSQIAIGVADQDGGPAARTLRSGLESSGIYRVATGEEDELLRELDKGRLRAVLVLPQGLSQAVERGQGQPEVVIRFDPSAPSSTAAMAGLRHLANGLVFGQSSPPLLHVRTVSIESINHLNVMDFMMPGMLIYMLLNAGVVTVAITVAYHRKQGTMRHMFSTPLSISVWVTGRTLANLLLALVQLGLVWIIGMAIFKVEPPSNLGGTLVVLIFSTLAALAIGLVIGALSRSAEASQPISLVTAMGLAFLGNAMMPLDGAPEVVQSLMRFMPSFYMTHALQRVMMKGQGLVQILPDMAVLLATAAIGFSLATWRLRRLFVTSA